jgi:cytochrome P450
MAELLQNPSSMAKARKKLTELIGSKQETEESDIWQLKYLQAVVNPAAPLLLPRQAETATEIRGYTLPRGARVLVNVWAIGRDPELWSV